MVNSKKILLLILATLLVFIFSSEALVIRQNLNLKNSYQQSEGRYFYLRGKYKKLVYENSFEGQNLPLFLENIVRLRKNKIIRKNTEFFTIFYFTIEDCSSCLTNAVVALNKFSSSNNTNKCQTIGLVDNTGIENAEIVKRSMNIRFPVVGIDSLKNKLEKLRIYSTPAIFFGSPKTGKTIYAFFPTPMDTLDEVLVEKLKRMVNE